MRPTARAVAFRGAVALCGVVACANDPRPGKSTAPAQASAPAGDAGAVSAPVDPFPELVARAAREAPGLAELSRGELVGPKTLILAPMEADGCLRLFADGDARLQDGTRGLTSGAPEGGAAPPVACVRKGTAVSVVVDVKAPVHYLLVGSTKAAR